MVSKVSKVTLIDSRYSGNSNHTNLVEKEVPQDMPFSNPARLSAQGNVMTKLETG